MMSSFPKKHELSIGTITVKLTTVQDTISNNHADEAMSLWKLGVSQERHFKHSGNLADIEQSISNLQKVVELMANGH